MIVERPSVETATRDTRPLAFDPIAEAARQWRAAGWDGEADGMAFVTSVVRAQQILLARIDECLTPFGLTFARFEVLMLLSFSPGRLPLGKIGARLQVHPASVTNAVDRLEQADWCAGPPTPPTGAPRWRRSPRWAGAPPPRQSPN